MKNLFFALLFTISLPTFAQSDLIVNLCDNNLITDNPKYNTITLSQEELFNCNTLIVNDTNYTVNSFTISFQNKGEDVVYEMISKGNKMNITMLSEIKKHSPKKIFVEKIQLLNSDQKKITTIPLILYIK